MGKKQAVALLTITIVVTTGYGGAIAINNSESFTSDAAYGPDAVNQSGLLISNSDESRYVVQVSIVPERIQKVNVSYENNTSKTYALSDEPVPLTGIITSPNITNITPSAPGFTLTTEVASDSRQRYDVEYDIPNTSVLVTVRRYSDGAQEFQTARVLRCDDSDPRLQRVTVNTSSQDVSIGSRCT